jgi:uncharacterized membrane protein
MHKNRLEAFSDGVIAILITIMVLELKTPHGPNFSDLTELSSVFLSYILSFIYLAIYWNNHHHLLQTVKSVNGLILWANIHLLFWLSLLPFVTAWSGENDFSDFPVAVYGFVLLMAGFAYYLLSRAIINHHGKGSLLAKAVGSDFKGKISLVVYSGAMIIAFWYPMIAFYLYVAVAIMWVIPDARIEKLLIDKSK